MDFDDEFEEFDLFLDQPEFTTLTRTMPPFEAIDILLDLNILAILQEELYLRTNPLNSRDILDLPIGMFDRDGSCRNNLFGVELFLNTFDRMYFSRKCDAICCYLALTQEDLLSELDQGIEGAKELAGKKFGLDPLAAIVLFKNGTIREHKFGFLFHGDKELKNWCFFWRLPLYYLIKHYWLTQKEQDALELAFGAGGDPETIKKFIDDHLIADKFGFGDFRLGFDMPIHERQKFSSRIGGHLTIPTSWAIKKGLKGSYYKPLEITSRTDLYDLTGYHINDILEMVVDQNPQASAVGENLAYDILDQLSANILESSLGNGRHLGIGFFLRSKTAVNIFIKRDWAHDIFYKSFISFEYLLPAIETRFFYEKIDPKLFEKRDFANEEMASDNMLFLEQQLVSRLIPYAWQATVYPGLVFRWMSKATYESDRWGFQAGTDMWIKTQEKICNIYATKKQIDNVEVCKARRILGYQAKILGSLFYKSRSRKRNWTVSLYVDQTFWQSGIGHDLTLSLGLEVDF